MSRATILAGAETLLLRLQGWFAPCMWLSLWDFLRDLGAKEQKKTWGREREKAERKDKTEGWRTGLFVLRSRSSSLI